MAPSLSSVLLAFQGLPILLFGGAILKDAAGAGFSDVPASVAHVIGFSSLSLAATYLTTALAAPRPARHAFLLATALLRLPAAWVFSRDGPDARGAPAWDYANAGLDVAVVVWERSFAR